MDQDVSDASGRVSPRAPAWLRRALLAALFAVCLLHVALAAGKPVGRYYDDALDILLAQELRRGDFRFPDVYGMPVTDPLPGWPALLAVPAWLLEPHWGWLRYYALVFSWIALACTWLLARELLPEPWPAAVALLTSLSPAWLQLQGVLIADMPYAAVSLALLFAFWRARSARAIRWIAACSGGAALIRPQGCLLAASMALAVGWRDGPRKGAKFLLIAAAPVASWLVRNWLWTGRSTGYASHWRSGQAALAGFSAYGGHVLEVVGTLLGSGTLALYGFPRLQCLAGFLLLLFAAFGAQRLLRARPRAEAMALAAYAGFLLILQASWPAVVARYAAPLAPLLWLLAAAFFVGTSRGRSDAGLGVARGAAVLGAESRAEPPAHVDARDRGRGCTPCPRPDRPGRLSGIASAVGAGALALFLAARSAPFWEARKTDPTHWRATMRWIRTHTASDARFQSALAADITLFAGRPAASPGLGPGADRDEWLFISLRDRFEFLAVDRRFAPGGYYGPELRSVMPRLEAWARSTPYATLAYEDSDDGSAIYRIRHPAPARYLRAFGIFVAADVARRRGADPDFVRRQLREALSLEPHLAGAWLSLASLEPAAALRREYVERARREDPTLAAFGGGGWGGGS